MDIPSPSAKDPQFPNFVTQTLAFNPHPQVQYQSPDFLPQQGASFRHPVTAASANFAMYSGSMRYKILTTLSRTDNILCQIVFQPFGGIEALPGLNEPNIIAFRPNVNGGYPVTIQNLSQDCGLEFELPFYTHYNQLLINSDPDVADSELQLYTTGTCLINFITDACLS